MNSILAFYLDTVLPTALAGVTEDIRSLKPHMESIQQIFDELKSDVTDCVSSRHVLLLQQSKDVNTRRSRSAQFCCSVPTAKLSVILLNMKGGIELKRTSKLKLGSPNIRHVT